MLRLLFFSSGRSVFFVTWWDRPSNKVKKLVGSGNGSKKLQSFDPKISNGRFLLPLIFRLIRSCTSLEPAAVVRKLVPLDSGIAICLQLVFGSQAF